jgi:hypothetical protein
LREYTPLLKKKKIINCILQNEIICHNISNDHHRGII